MLSEALVARVRHALADACVRLSGQPPGIPANRSRRPFLHPASLLTPALVGVFVASCASSTASEPTSSATPTMTSAAIPTVARSSGTPTAAAISPTTVRTSTPTTTPPRPSATQTPRPIMSASPTTGATPVGGTPMTNAAVAQARQDLSSRLSVQESQISVERVEEVDWRDSSLGCPQPGQMYAQVITPGYRIVLRVKDQTYEYHADRGNRVIYCQNPRQ